jgi:hypothetical protein
MEKWIEFRKAIEAAKAGKEWQEQDGTEQNVRIHSSCNIPPCYYRRYKRILGRRAPYHARILAS